jgi:heat shock protein HslJ
VVSVAGVPAEASRPAEVAFARDGQGSGSTGCNRFTGRYELTGETLTFGPLAATRMACPPPQMEQESRVFDLLQAVRGFDITDGGDLVLLAGDGRRLVARRSP